MVEVNLLRIGFDSTAAKSGADTFASGSKRVEDSAKRTGGALKNLDTRFTKSGAAARSAAASIRSVFGAVSTALVFRQAVTAVASFQDSLVTLRGVTRATNAEFLQLTEGTLELGATTRFTANQVSEGFLFLGRAGFEVNEALTALPSTIDLAAVANIGLGQASNATASILRQFALDVDETTNVVDALTIVSNRTNVTITQLAQSLSFVGPIAGSFGQSVEQTSAALGVLGDRGIRASIGGTQLRAVLLKLTNPTKAATRIFDDLNLNFTELDPSANDLITIFTRLGDAGLTAAQAGAIFGNRAAATAIILSQNADAFRELTAETVKNRGETEEIADAIEQTLGGSLRALRASIEAVFITVGRSDIGKAFQDLVDSITDGLRVLSGFDDQLRTTSENAEKFAKLIKGGLGFLTFTSALKVARTAVFALEAALASTGIGLIPVAIGAATVAIFAFREEIGSFEIAGIELRDILVGAFEAIQERAEFLFEVVPEVARQSFDQIKTVLTTGFGVIFDVVNTALMSLNENFSLSFEGIGNIAKALANIVITAFVNLGEAITRTISAVRLVSRELSLVDFSNPLSFLDSLKGLGDSSFAGIDKAFKGFGEDIFKNASEDFVGDITGALKDLSTPLLQGFQGQFDDEAVTAFFDIVGDARDKALANATQREAQAIADGFQRATLDFVASLGPDNTSQGSTGETRGQFSSPEDPRTQAQIDFITSVLDGINAIEDERAALGQSNNEREKTILLRRAEALGISESDATLQTYIETIDNLSEEQKLQEASTALTGIFADASTELLKFDGNAKEILENFLRRLLDLAVQAAVIKPIFDALNESIQGAGTSSGGGTNFFGGLISSLFGAKDGAIFSGGSVVPFQKGGIIESPTLFPLSGNRVGAVAENAPESAFPITRDSQGRLAVFGAGGGGGQNITVNQTIVTPDPKSFKASRRQMEDQARQLARSFE